MRRPALKVRSATEADLPDLLALFDQMRHVLRLRSGRTPDQLRAAAEERYCHAMLNPEERLLVVTDAAGTVLGLALLTLSTVTNLFDAPAVTMGQLHVTPGARNRGAGRALIAAAAQWAEERGVEAVSVTVPPQARESARFYARLGFAPTVVQRVAPVAMLRRRLGPDAIASALTSLGETGPAVDRRGMRARLLSARAGAVSRRQAAG